MGVIWTRRRRRVCPLPTRRVKWAIAQPVECMRKIGHHRVKRLAERGCSRNHDIVMSRQCPPAPALPHGLTKAAANPVANDRIAIGLGDGEAETRRPFVGRRQVIRFGTLGCQQYERLGIDTRRRAHRNKFAALFQTANACFPLWTINAQNRRFLSRYGEWTKTARRSGQAVGRPAASGRKTLASASTPRGQNLASAICRHARAKAVAALADQLARLKGTFHLGPIRCSGGSSLNSCDRFRCVASRSSCANEPDRIVRRRILRSTIASNADSGMEHCRGL